MVPTLWLSGMSSEEYTFNICFCKHGNFEHVLGYDTKGLYRHMQCEKCGCPDYGFCGEMTHAEWNEFKEKKSRSDSHTGGMNGWENKQPFGRNLYVADEEPTKPKGLLKRVFG